MTDASAQRMTDASAQRMTDASAQRMIDTGAQRIANAAFVSGKDHKSENFPVGSRLIAAQFRPAVMAYYRFARAADDIADAPAPPAERLALLAAMESGLDAGLAGRSDPALPGVAVALGRVMAARHLDPANARDLLVAFRRDVTRSRYAEWDDLMDYCRWSAMPVGRFMLDVHGEAPGLRPASDALCAALQVINHLQDCREDLADMDRVYVPAAALTAAGLDVTALAAPEPPPALADMVRGLAARCTPLLDAAADFAPAIAASGLAYEVAVIHALACDLVVRLQRDPFAASRHHGKMSAALIAIRACGAMAIRRNGVSRRSRLQKGG
jgi:squalene synthase HpnC